MRRFRLLYATFSLLLVLVISGGAVMAQSPNPQSGSVGMQGTISAPPPTTPATITTPNSGQGFSDLPVTVSGLCTGDLLIKLFKNNVFAGSAQCQNGSYSIIIDLFNGQNELVARVFDSLDQAGPDSNIVRVVYTNARQGAAPRVSLTSDFAKRGANPGQTLTWPIILSGGFGPYALSVDWGDGKTPDLRSEAFPGTIELSHVYDRPGIYNIIVKATDKNGGVAFLQLVGVANGPLSQTQSSGEDANANTTVAAPKARILWEPAAILIPMIVSTFWLGKKYELRTLRRKIEQGERPF